MKDNRINPIDNVSIEIYEGAHKVDTIMRSGMHSVSEAVEAGRLRGQQCHTQSH